LEAKGSGEMTRMTLHVYAAYFSCVDRARCGWSPQQPFALQLVYHRSLVGSRIAERSVEEIAKLGYGTADQRGRWGEQMKQIFPDVVDGDRIVGVNLPQSGARFYYNGKPIGGENRGPRVRQGIFGIWLDPAPRAGAAQEALGRAIVSGGSPARRVPDRRSPRMACSGCRWRWRRFPCMCICRNSTAIILA
jgi:hypothetical protein